MHASDISKEEQSTRAEDCAEPDDNHRLGGVEDRFLDSVECRGYG